MNITEMFVENLEYIYYNGSNRVKKRFIDDIRTNFEPFMRYV